MDVELIKPAKLIQKKGYRCKDCGSSIECDFLDTGQAVLTFPAGCKTKQDCLDMHCLHFGLSFTRP